MIEHLVDMLGSGHERVGITMVGRIPARPGDDSRAWISACSWSSIERFLNDRDRDRDLDLGEP